MAGKISELAPITGAALALTDDIETRDVSDLSMAATGTNKSLTLAELILFLQGHGMASGLIVDDVPPADTSVLWADTTEQGWASNTVLAGTVAPTSGDGNDGDFWINTTTWMIYGPRDDAVWPAGVSMTGGGGGGGLDQATADTLYLSKTGDDVPTADYIVRSITAWGSVGAESVFEHLGCDTLYVNESIQIYTPFYLDGTANVPTDPRHATSKGYVDGQDALRQPIDADLTAIAALAPADNTVMQRKAGAWVASTPATVKTDLAIAAGDVSGLGALATATVPITVAQGGSGRATATTAYGLIAAGTTATGAEQTVAPAASGFLKTTSTTALPAWAAIASTDVSGLGSLATKSTIVSADITDNTVANNDLATMAANTVKMNNTAGTAAPTDVTIANLLTALGLSVPVTVAQGGSGRATATTAYGLLAAGTTATGVQQTVSPAASGFLKTTSTTALPAWTAIAAADVSGLGSLATLSAVGAAQITDGVVSNTELSTMPANTIKGNNTGATAAPIDMTVAQAKVLLGIDNITVASTAPSSPAVNDLWVDTT